MEIELQFTPDIESFYSSNQNADIFLNERALMKNKSLNPSQKDYMRQLVQDVNKYSNYSSLSGNQLAEARDKYNQLKNLAGIYGISDYIRTGQVSDNKILMNMGLQNGIEGQPLGSEGIEGEKVGGVEEVTYKSNFPGKPKDDDLRKGYVPKAWVDEQGNEITMNDDWHYNSGTGMWEGQVNGQMMYRSRNEAPEWEVFIPAERMIKRVSISMTPNQAPMGRGEWKERMKGAKKTNEGNYQAKVGTVGRF